MDHGQLSMAADKFPWVFSESVLNACGKEVQFCRRQRVSTPLRLGVALTATGASQPVETIADFHGGVHALFGTTITSKAFSNPVAKPHGADVARTMTERLIGAMTLQVLGCAQGHPCGECRRLILQDGSSFAIHDGLREVLPGRCTTVKPAAVALHTTMDLLGDAPTTVGLTPDTTNAPAFWPEPATLTGAWRLADRGSIDVHSRRRVQDAGGGCLIRANAGMNPQILEALREDGQRLRSLRQKSLQTIHATRPKRQRVARVVQWHVDGRPLRLRLLVSGHRRQQALCSLLTHLPAPRDTLERICRASTWRWHGA